MIDDKDIRMYIRSRHSVHDTPQQIADSLKKIKKGAYTVQVVEDILKQMGYKPYTESRRSKEAEQSEAHRRQLAVKNFSNTSKVKKKKPAANKIIENNYVPKVIYYEKVRDEIRILHAEDKTINQIAQEIGATKRQIEDTIIDMGLRPVYGRKTVKKLSEEEKQEIVKRHDEGLSFAKISSMYDVTATAVRKICNAKKKLKGQIML